MKIVTKTGDRGKTSLCGGKRVSKDSIRMEACGDLDELCSYLGSVKAQKQAGCIRSLLEEIQKDLFVAGSELASSADKAKRFKTKISARQVKRLEQEIQTLENKNNIKLDCFYLPGGSPASSSLDVSRAISRRLERRVVSLWRRKLLSNKHILVYLNRLSDLLFLLARYFPKAKGSRKPGRP